MKKLMYAGALAILLGGTFVGCQKEKPVPTAAAKTEQATMQAKATIVIDENNVGYYHNEIVRYVIDQQKGLSAADINKNMKSPIYVATKMQAYCKSNGIQLPNAQLISSAVAHNAETSLTYMLNHEAFSGTQREILTSAFSIIQGINVDLDNYEPVLATLNNYVTTLQGGTDGQGKRVSIAIVNQLIASTEMWVRDGGMNSLPIQYPNSQKPTPGEVLGADGKGLGTALLFGGWTSPIGWAGSLFVGAGASIGKYIDSNWWPY